MIDGKKLSSLRRKLALSQEMFARRADVSRETVRRLENEPCPAASMEIFHRLANGLGLNVDGLRDAVGVDEGAVDPVITIELPASVVMLAKAAAKHERSTLAEWMRRKAEPHKVAVATGASAAPAEAGSTAEAHAGRSPASRSPDRRPSHHATSK